MPVAARDMVARAARASTSKRSPFRVPASKSKRTGPERRTSTTRSRSVSPGGSDRRSVAGSRSAATGSPVAVSNSKGPLAVASHSVPEGVRMAVRQAPVQANRAGAFPLGRPCPVASPRTSNRVNGCRSSAPLRHTSRKPSSRRASSVPRMEATTAPMLWPCPRTDAFSPSFPAADSRPLTMTAGRARATSAAVSCRR